MPKAKNPEAPAQAIENPSDVKALHRAAARKWNANALQGEGRRRIWQQSLTIRQHINKKICGKPLGPMNAGLDMELKRRLNGRTLGRGISIGCGRAAKEIALLEQGVVEKFDCFDLATEPLAIARRTAAEKGLEDRIVLSDADAFENARETYDLVYWNSSLHHMLDVEAAVKWSREHLSPNGVLYVREYAGPSRFQFTDRQIELATRFRAALPRRFLLNPAGKAYLPDQPKIIPLETIIASDPTESVDSAKIVPSLEAIFPEAQLWRLGGAIYYVAMTGILGNFDEEDDQDWLRMALAVDDMCIELGENMIIGALAMMDG